MRTLETTHTPPPPARGWGIDGGKSMCHSGVLTVRHDVQHGVPIIIGACGIYAGDPKYSFSVENCFL